MPMDASPLPPIEAWWPYITLGARHRIMSHLRDPLDRRVRGEVETVTGRHLDPDAELTEDDRRFVVLQNAMSE
jgi:hypothetical protein